MKKNLFFGLMALTGLFTSCSQDDANAPSAADSKQVSMSIEMPADFVKTRAAAPQFPSEHNLRCILEVWTEDGFARKVRQEQLVSSGAANFTFNFQLEAQGNYKAVLWADYIASGTTETSGHYPDKYYKTNDADGLKKVTIIESAYAYTDQVREAFTAVKPFTKSFTAEKNLTATLVRPLTKVTIAEKNAEMFGKCTGMTATYTVPSEFNAFSETVSATATYNATYNAAPKGGDITIHGNNCKILFSDYIFTASDGTMGGIELTFTGTATLNDRSIPANIPLKRNNWVRAAGNLITTSNVYDPAVALSVDMTTDWANEVATDIPDAPTTVNVGDYYYKDGTWSAEDKATTENPIIGVVYKVLISTDPKYGEIRGRVVSLSEPANLEWATDGNNVTTGATSPVDGKENTDKIFKGVAAGTYILTNYPIFEACKKQRTDTGNDEWYIPVDNSVFFFSGYMSPENLTLINTQIRAISGVELIAPTNNTNGYWTSREHRSDNDLAYLSNTNNGGTTAPKSTKAKVRFVLDF